MKARHFQYVLAFGAAWMLATAALAQEKKPAAKGAAPPAAKPGEPSPEDMAKMMEAFQKAATPGEHHAKLKPLAGKWSFVTKARMGPDQPWEESKGKAEYKWILGGRILVQEVKAEPSPGDAMMGGAPFEGFGLTGYDNMTKEYWNVWGDNYGTGVMMSTGSADPSGKTFTYTGEYNDPMTGEAKTARSVLKIAGDDKLVFEMYNKGPDGKEYQMLEVTYTRQK